MISVFDLFKIGIGPSSSHTVGPMRAARRFLVDLQETCSLDSVGSIQVELYGSLALTGKGHGTDKALVLGLQGYEPHSIRTEEIDEILARVASEQKLPLLGEHEVPFVEKKHIVFFKRKKLPYHSNAMRFIALDKEGNELAREVYYSVGGGFVVDHKSASQDCLAEEPHSFPYPFKSCSELVRLCREHGLNIQQLMWENEKVLRAEEDVRSGLLEIWQVMKDCVKLGCQREGILPGGINVKRRAPALLRDLESRAGQIDPAAVMDWVSLWALATNEENAAGGRVVTAPTNGAAGVIPAVLHYYIEMMSGADEEGICTFLLVSGAIGILYKEGASISAAEMGCQGEIGVACSMAAGGLAAVMGGSLAQIENAAEIGMEHNLGLTCDPVAGLVQIPCIERNTMGAIKAINAARLALRGDGISNRVRLDQVIATMHQTGKDMKSIYKETSQGGLAVNVPEC